MQSRFQQLRAQLRAEAGSFPWQVVLWRMGVDLVLLNASLLAAFMSWFFLALMLFPTTFVPAKLAASFKQYALNYWPFWSVLGLLTFHLSGFYTRTRGYQTRYKWWVVFRAISLFVIIFVFADYFVFRSSLMPRGVAVLSWLLTLLTVGGSRRFKTVFLKQYKLESRKPVGRIERVLVVGGAGYLGSELVHQLLAREYKVRVLDALLFGDSSLNSVKTNPNFELSVGDVRDIEAVVQNMRDCQAVIHLAAIVGDPACEENRPLATEVNRAATRMLIEIARGYGVSRFLFASTCSVYGASEFLVDEHTQPLPISTYAQTKIDSEKLLFEAADVDFHPVVLRLGTLFGLSPRPRFDLVVNLLTARAATTGKITIFNGEQWRPFLHVRDAARAFVKCLEAPATLVSKEIFNVGDYGLNKRLSEVSAAIVDAVPTVEVQRVDNGDKRNYRVSFDKIHTRVGFVCETSLEEGIREIYEAIIEKRIDDFTAARFNNQAIMQARKGVADNDGGKSSLRVLRALAESD
jgi:nucleoside-diphosphate-sugar epimerase